MALNDCLRKLKRAGIKLTDDQLEVLNKALADGLSEDMAVRRALLLEHKNIVDIADRARNEGATLAPVTSPVTQAVEFQGKALEKIREERNAINDEITELGKVSGDINTNIGDLYEEMGKAVGFYKPLDNMETDAERVMYIGQAMFKPEMKSIFERGVLTIKGTTPKQILNSWKAENAAGKVRGKRLNKLVDRSRALEKQIDVIFSGTGEQTLYQDRGRASITFQAEAGAIIRMSEAKDLSSFLHESAHLYLEMMGDLVLIDGVDVKLIDDFNLTMKYLGVETREEITSEHHEMFARSFEAYLREGVAPTAELQPLFSTFKGWLTRVYQVLGELLGAEEQLSDDIRGVFDRLVASESAIKQSEDMMMYVQLYQTADEMGVSEEVFNVYKRGMQEAHDEEVDAQSKKMIKAMYWGQQQWWKAELAKVADTVRAEAEQMPVYIALAMLQKGQLPNGEKVKIMPVKLDRDDLIARYGKDFMDTLPNPRNKENPGKYVYSAKGGMDADLAASMFGFPSADAMIEALKGAPNMEAYIDAKANEIMQANHPDPMNSPDLIDESTRAVHNQKRSQILGAELRALRRQQKADAKIVRAVKDQTQREEREARDANKGQLPKRESMASIKAAATEVVGAMRIRDVNPNAYLQAERKAGRLAFEAMGRKDYAEAYRQKRAQLMNFEAYRASIKLKEQAARDLKYLKGFEKPKGRRRNRLRERMGKAGQLPQIDAVLENIDLAQRSLSNIDKAKLEDELIAGIEAGLIITTPDVIKLLKGSTGTSWRDMTFQEFGGVRDVIKQLEHQARTDLKAIINGEEVIIQESVDAVANGIIEANEAKAVPRKGETGWETVKRGGREGVGHWLRSSTIARILDKAGFGAVTRHVIVPIRRAYAEKLIPRQQQAGKDVAVIYQEHYSNEELTQLGKPTADVMGEQMSKADILAMALNWGSQSNRSALLGGVLTDAQGNQTPAYTQEGVAQALNNMDARDWAFVQAMWRYEDSYYAELAETEIRRRGIAPTKIEGLTFEVRTSDGETIMVEGGYHPLQYDSRHSGKLGNTEEEFQKYYDKMMSGGYLSANTRAGATFERAENHGRVVRLSLSTIDHNLRELIRDMTLGDEIKLVNRILNSKEVGDAARGTNNKELLDELKLWLSDAAVGELPAQSIIEKSLSWTRVGFTKSKLAFNVYVTVLQLTGIFQSIAVIGTRAYARGFGKFLKDPVGNYKMVMETSKFMQARYGLLQTWDKDVSDTAGYLNSMFGPAPTKFKQGVELMGHYYFYPIAKMQSLVDVTTWMGSYEAALNDPKVMSDEEAIYAADTAVENTQTSGLFSDRSGIERGTLGTRTRQGQFVRLWTTLISYMLAKGNIAYEKGVRTDFRDPKQVVNFATDMVLLYTMEGIASAILYDRWPGDEDEDETTARWVLDATADSILSGIPMVREFSAAKYGSGNTPVGAVVKDSYDFIRQAEQGDMDEALVKAGIKVTGTLFHLPASQPNRAVEALFEEDGAEWYELILGVREGSEQKRRR